MKTIIRLIAVLALSTGVSFGQGTGGGTTIQTQNNGTTTGTFKRYFVLNCVSGLTCSVSGSTLGITVTGGAGTVTTTGSPANGNLAKFSGATSIVNGDISGDCTTSGSLAIICTKTNGTSFATVATSGSASDLSSGTLAAARGGVGIAPFYSTSSNAGSAAALTLNKVLLNGFYLSTPVTFTQLTYRILTADNTADTYDLGIYNASGTLICDFGSIAGTVFAPSSNTNMTIACTQGTVIAPAGKYYVGVTAGTAATATVAGASSYWTFIASNTLTTSGGALAGSISPPADSWQTSTVMDVILR